MESRFLRIAYAIQFVVTLMAIFEVWAQVGGQGHLDLIPWYYKLVPACALSLATVKATAAVWAVGVPILPLVVPGAFVSPGASTCNFLNAPTLTVMLGLVLAVLLPLLTVRHRSLDGR